MTTCECAKRELTANLPWQARLMPAYTRDAICEAYVLHRGKLHGVALQKRIRQHVADVGALPPIVWQLLLNAAIQVIIRVLDKWWDGRHKP